MLFNVESYQIALANKFLSDPNNKTVYLTFMQSKGLTAESKWPEDEKERMELMKDMMNHLYEHGKMPSFTPEEIQAFVYDETKIEEEK